MIVVLNVSIASYDVLSSCELNLLTPRQLLIAAIGAELKLLGVFTISD